MTTTGAHAAEVLAWDVPSAIAAGERFTMKVGLRCADECDLSNAAFSVHDHEGTLAASGTLTGDRWPGTTALYVAEIELVAPAAEGLHTWSIAGPRPDDGIPHAEGSATFGVRVVSRPECVVSVEAIDQASGTPLGGARVVMHPYNAVTDEHGVARLKVAKGAYRLFVTQTRYTTYAQPIEVTADVAARAELSVEPVLERN
jgi:hypothetical protein